MGDVHGRKRAVITSELRDKEIEKIKVYNELVTEFNKCQHLSWESYLDQVDAEAALSLSEKILHMNPDFYTVWNLRRRVLDNQKVDRDAYVRELKLFMQLIRVNPKSYWLWNHRCWCLQTMPEPKWYDELALVEQMLSLDARNFHGWNYRRYVVNKLCETVEKDEQDKIALKEYDFTTRKINQSFSNYSAWHQRSKLLPEITATMSIEEKNRLVEDELEMIKNAIYTDPNDQSAWLYYWWLVGRTPEHVSMIGAFQHDSSRVVIIGFSDVVRFIQPPNVLNASKECIPGSWSSLSASSETSSIWMFEPKVKGATTVNLNIGDVIPCNGAKTIHKVAISRKITTVNINKDVMDARIGAFQERVHAMHTDPANLSAQRYSDPIMKNPTPAWYSLDRVQLLNKEIQSVRELLEIEPGSKWALQTLARFLQQLKLSDSNQNPKTVIDEIIGIFEKLSSIDNYRAGRYDEERMHAIFERIILDLCCTDETTGQLSLRTQPVDRIDFRAVSLQAIPVPAYLLLVRCLSADSTPSIQNALKQLPFLEEFT